MSKPIDVRYGGEADGKEMALDLPLPATVLNVFLAARGTLGIPDDPWRLRVAVDGTPAGMCRRVRGGETVWFTLGPACA